MAITARTTATKRVPMDSMRKIALAAGVLYLITFITSIPALILKDPLLNNPNFILGSGSSTGVVWAGYLDVFVALSCIGTAIVLYPVARRVSQIAAIGFVTSRLLEGAIIILGVVSILSVVTLRQDLAGVAGADAAALVTIGASLVAVHNWTFLLGPGLMAGVNALLLGYVMYRSRLVPRIIPMVGLIGGAPLILASATATIFGFYDQISLPGTIAAFPVALWELSLGVWLVVKGFNASAITSESVNDERNEAGAMRVSVA
jgi:hypothetical protein